MSVRRPGCERSPQLRLAVVGTGLIGASVGLAAKRAGNAGVAGFDADERRWRRRSSEGRSTPCQVDVGRCGRRGLVCVAVPVVQALVVVSSASRRTTAAR